jgi:aconitase A
MLTTTSRPALRGYSVRELQRCAEREANLRRQVYSNRVLTKRMSRQQANAEIDKMAAIAEWLKEMAEREKLL